MESYGAVTELGVTLVVAPKPHISSVQLSGTNVMAAGNGGAWVLVYCVLTTTNLAAPLANWVPVSTNAFDSAGNFSFTYAGDPTLPQQFFRLQIE